VQLLLASITTRNKKNDFDALASLYINRITTYIPVETTAFRSEEVFLEMLGKQRGRVAPLLVLLDSRGRQFSSEQFAGWIGEQRDQGRQQIVFAIGSADGWSDATRKRAGMLLSLGPMTLPHELARVVLCEQVYRAFTILTGHPYHRGS
jgi:23S rRNA (pseudouridine1915-N3)-methyltransferase